MHQQQAPLGQRRIRRVKVHCDRTGDAAKIGAMTDGLTPDEIALHLDPLAYVIGLEGVALLRRSPGSTAADASVPDPWPLMTWASIAANAAYSDAPRAMYLQLHKSA